MHYGFSDILNLRLTSSNIPRLEGTFKFYKWNFIHKSAPVQLTVKESFLYIAWKHQKINNQPENPQKNGLGFKWNEEVKSSMRFFLARISKSRR